MSDINTGGQAFPLMFTHATTARGMTLRDYFAAKAMQAELTIFGNMPSAEIARRAYEMADAMLSARSTEKAREQT